MARRSVLFAPGDDPEVMHKAAAGEADVVVFDLEDAVAPADKPAAREAVGEVLADVDPDCEVCVRLNPVGVAAARDLTAVLANVPPDSVMLPKVHAAEDVRTLTRMLQERNADLPVLAVVESAKGVLAADAIATAGATDAVLFGAEDLAADIGATRTTAGTEVLYARERVVLAASAAGVDAIDTLYTDYEDTEGLREDTTVAAELGYDGKIVIHPDQVPVVNEAFTPDAADVEWAERVLAAREETDAGVFEVDGEMIDAPLITQAERIVERAQGAEE